MDEGKMNRKTLLIIAAAVLIVIIAVPIIVMVISSKPKVTLDDILKVNTLENVLKEKGNIYLYDERDRNVFAYYEQSGDFIISLIKTTNFYEDGLLMYKNKTFIIKNNKAYLYYDPYMTNEESSLAVYNTTINQLDTLEFLKSKKVKGKYIIEAELPSMMRCEITVDKNYFVESIEYHKLKDCVKDKSIKIEYSTKKGVPQIADIFFESDEKVKVSIVNLLDTEISNKEFEITKGQMFALNRNLVGIYSLYYDSEGLNIYGDGHFSDEPVTEDLQLYLIESKVIYNTLGKYRSQHIKKVGTPT